MSFATLEYSCKRAVICLKIEKVCVYPLKCKKCGTNSRKKKFSLKSLFTSVTFVCYESLCLYKINKPQYIALF